MLEILTGWRGYAATAATAGIIAAGAAWTVQGWRYGAQIAEIYRAQAQALADAQTQARAVEQQRAAAIEKVQNNAQKQIATANADAAAASDAASRLRVELENLRSRVAASRAGAGAGGQDKPGSDPVGVLIGLLEGMESTGREISQYADRVRVAGLTCERSYDVIRSTR